jgi:acetoacetyl-CoA synthetase
MTRVVATRVSPRHVPDEIVEVTEVPRTRTGKKLEMPAKRILKGGSIGEIASRAFGHPSIGSPPDRRSARLRVPDERGRRTGASTLLQ